MAGIWDKDYELKDIVWMAKDTMMEALGMELTEIGPEFLSGRMPIDKRTVQPMRILHGGASVALAETLGSIGSYMVIDTETHYCVGQVITANHLRPGKGGFANGVARILHKGRTSHIWNIDITDDEGKLLCVCRLTMAVVKK
jgi:1,4-dihydroxy-2-naphthoyl-CoA hydrolase